MSDTAITDLSAATASQFHSSCQDQLLTYHKILLLLSDLLALEDVTCSPFFFFYNPTILTENCAGI